MKESPINLKAHEVRAILAGTKTQTRRVVSALTADRINHCPGFLEDLRHVSSPYGQPGDRLWVREAWRVEGRHTDGYSPQCIGMNRSHFGRIDYEASITWNKSMYGKLRHSIHMPRWASRITLEIVSVRVERLQDISEADALSEGCELECMTPTGDDSGSAIYGPGGYLALWESINGPGSWNANPWVWVAEFKRAEGGAKC